jgi:hypothetical protein
MTFAMKFLDGTPVPPEYAGSVAKMVREAADGDPGEEGELNLAPRADGRALTVADFTPIEGDLSEEDEPTEQDRCAHRWVYTGTNYGGDDESHHGDGRCYCDLCGADGDA